MRHSTSIENGFVPAPAGSWPARAGSRAIRAWIAWRRWHLERATAKALEGLSDRTLHDIGLDRSQIQSAAREAAEGRRWQSGWTTLPPA